MLHVMVHQRVTDFAKWKPVYDRQVAAREKAGIKELRVWRTFEDPNEVVMLFQGADIARVRGFFEDVKLRKANAKAGVTDKPEIYLLR